MGNYNLSVRLPHLEFSHFKDKEMRILMSTISSCRIGEEISFNQYGHITYNDTIGTKIHLDEMGDHYDKNLTNCLIYDIVPSSYNKDYTKLFIYQSIGKEISNYGFIMLDEKNNKEIEVHTLEYSDDILIHRITEYMHKIPTYTKDYWDKKMNKMGLTKRKKKAIEYYD